MNFGSRSCTRGGSDGKSRRRFRENTDDGGGGAPGGQPVRRRRPKISASTAEFLAQIDKVSRTWSALLIPGIHIEVIQWLSPSPEGVGYSVTLPMEVRRKMCRAVVLQIIQL